MRQVHATTEWVDDRPLPVFDPRSPPVDHVRVGSAPNAESGSDPCNNQATPTPRKVDRFLASWRPHRPHQLPPAGPLARLAAPGLPSGGRRWATRQGQEQLQVAALVIRLKSLERPGGRGRTVSATSEALILRILVSPFLPSGIPIGLPGPPDARRPFPPEGTWILP